MAENITDEWRSSHLSMMHPMTSPGSDGPQPPSGSVSPFTKAPSMIQSSEESLSTIPLGSATRRPDSKKRKRTDEEQAEWERRVKLKVEQESENLDAAQQNNAIYSEIHGLYNQVPAIAPEFQETSPVPEIVLAAAQSDGKSHFVNALVGHPFNIVTDGIGTRCPLIVQMMNNPAKAQPSCRFLRLELAAAGVSSGFSDQDFDAETPIGELNGEFIRRTEALAGPSSEERISDVPIILRVEFANCANLTIYDPPGLRPTEKNEALASRIEEMVTSLITPHRIIVCLGQACSPWSNFPAREFVKKVDPKFQRTVFVMTKFNTRLKQIQTAEAANDYLAGDKHFPPANRPFFISLPVKRDLVPAEFNEEIKECYLSDYKDLSLLGFDEERFRSQIGFFRVKNHLENLLQSEYMRRLAPTLSFLIEKHDDVDHRLQLANKNLEASDASVQRLKVLKFVKEFSTASKKLIDGSMVCDHLEKWGHTTQQERIQSGVRLWPGDDMVKLVPDIPGSELLMVGHAQMGRCIEEFKMAILCVEFPNVTISEVVDGLGGHSGTNIPPVLHAAIALVRQKSKENLLPLIDIGIKRYAYTIRRVADVAFAQVSKNHHVGVSLEKVKSTFNSLFDKLITEVRENCVASLTQFVTHTIDYLDGKIMTFSGATGQQSLSTFDERRKRILAETSQEFPGHVSLTRDQIMKEEGAEVVRGVARQLWAGIRWQMANSVVYFLNSEMIKPFISRIKPVIADHFQRMDEASFVALFQAELAQARLLAGELQRQAATLAALRDRFKRAVEQLQRGPARNPS